MQSGNLHWRLGMGQVTCILITARQSLVYISLSPGLFAAFSDSVLGQRAVQTEKWSRAVVPKSTKGFWTWNTRVLHLHCHWPCVLLLPLGHSSEGVIVSEEVIVSKLVVVSEGVIVLKGALLCPMSPLGPYSTPTLMPGSCTFSLSLLLSLVILGLGGVATPWCWARQEQAD